MTESTITPDEEGGPEVVVDPDAPAEATEGDEVLETGGRTDNSGELTARGESQDPDEEVASDPEVEDDVDG